jgi:hypothetical protein
MLSSFTLGESVNFQANALLVPLLSSWDRGGNNSAVATGDVPKQPTGLSTPLKGIRSKLVA